MPFPPAIARTLIRALGRPESLERTKNLHFNDAGHGYDRFGMHPDFVAFGDALVSPIYEKYFRVKSYGAHNIPADGPAILAANHSGTLPVDGAMVWMDVLRNTNPPRVSRALADFFVSALPVVTTLFSRSGVVSGSRGNARALLESGELLMIFPEGVPGIGKPFSKRYQLQKWTKGHCEMAIRYRAPVVPVAVIGAEEQMPQIASIPMPEPIPYLPIVATPFPLPVRYHIHYGEPIPFQEEFSPSDADDPEIVANAAARVKAAVAELIEKGLEMREGVFT